MSPKRMIFNCRGFTLAVPLLAALALAMLQQPATGSDPDATNMLLAQCVDAERASGRSGRGCIGRVTEPCKAKKENAHRDDQMECDEREFVLWSQLLQKEFERLEKMLAPQQQDVLRNSQSLWVKYQSDDCRVPYALFSQERAEFAGPACTIELKASRALQLRAWREALANL